MNMLHINPQVISHGLPLPFPSPPLNPPTFSYHLLTLPPSFPIPCPPFSTQFYIWSTIFSHSESQRANWSIILIDKYAKSWLHIQVCYVQMALLYLCVLACYWITIAYWMNVCTYVLCIYYKYIQTVQYGSMYISMYRMSILPLCMCIQICRCMNAYIHTYLDISTCLPTAIHTSINTYIMLAYIHPSIHTYIYNDSCMSSYIHAYMYTDSCMSAYIHTTLKTKIHT